MPYGISLGWWEYTGCVGSGSETERALFRVLTGTERAD